MLSQDHLMNWFKTGSNEKEKDASFQSDNLSHFEQAVSKVFEDSFIPKYYWKNDSTIWKEEQHPYFKLFS